MLPLSDWLMKRVEKSMKAMTHYGDPCIHCGVAHDDVEPGPCKGDPKKAKPLAWCSMGVRWDKVEHYRIRYSDGRVEDRWDHIGFNVPYYHFGYVQSLQSPPPYDEKLKGYRS